jgi:hypothetical protein
MISIYAQYYRCCRWSTTSHAIVTFQAQSVWNLTRLLDLHFDTLHLIAPNG